MNSNRSFWPAFTVHLNRTGYPPTAHSLSRFPTSLPIPLPYLSIVLPHFASSFHLHSGFGFGCSIKLLPCFPRLWLLMPPFVHRPMCSNNGSEVFDNLQSLLAIVSNSPNCRLLLMYLIEEKVRITCAISKFDPVTVCASPTQVLMMAVLKIGVLTSLLQKRF